MFTAHFTRRFCAAHRLMDDPGVCSRIHGHNYEAEILVESDALWLSNMVIPADEIKRVVDEKYDHRLILELDDPLVDIVDCVVVQGAPSTEYLASQIADDVATAAWDFLKGHAQGVHVTVLLRETPTIQAQATASIEATT